MNESTFEEAALDYLRVRGWSTTYGPSIDPDSARPMRGSYEQVHLYDRLREAPRGSTRTSGRP